jgi:hypothetical protein
MGGLFIGLRSVVPNQQQAVVKSTNAVAGERR